MSEKVQIFEVGPRDGLQNEKGRIPFATKKWFIQALARAGVSEIEIGSFVHPQRVPQMADTDRLYSAFRKGLPKKTRVWSLVPNLVGLERALQCQAKNIAVFTASTDTFNQKNIGRTVLGHLKELRTVVTKAKEQRLSVRGYVSTAFGCPYEGKVKASQPLRVTEKLLEMGCEQVEISDTIGVATPGDIDRVIRPAIQRFGVKSIAVHFHDTRGTALSNNLRSIQHGVRTLDASAGGLGGCPFAPGATGNVATEDLVYLLHGLGLRTGVDLQKLCEISIAMSKKMRRPLTSRLVQAYAANPRASRVWF